MTSNTKRIFWIVMLFLLGCSLPDEYTIYHWADYWLTTIDYSGKDSTALHRQLSDQVPPSGLEYAIPFLRHGEETFLLMNHGKMYVADKSLGKIQYLVGDIDVTSEQVAIAPNGDFVVVPYARGLYRISTDGGAFVSLTDDSNFYDWQPNYSFDGKKIAFVREKKGWHAICYFDTDDNSVHVLRNTSQENAKVPHYYFPRFSPDGQYVYYLFSSVSKSGLYRLTISNGQIQLLLKTYIYHPHPVCFAQTGRYLFENNRHLYVGENDGNAPQNLGEFFYDDYGLVEYQLSADGQYIVYSPNWRYGEIWLMDFDGSNNRKISNGVHPFFMPGEKRILFYAKHWHKGKDVPYNLDFGRN